jgi:WD40 repeat protein
MHDRDANGLAVSLHVHRNEEDDDCDDDLTARVNSVAFTSDGQNLASGGGATMVTFFCGIFESSCKAPRWPHIFGSTYKPTPRFRQDRSRDAWMQIEKAVSRDDNVCASFSANGELVAFGDHDRAVRLLLWRYLHTCIVTRRGRRWTTMTKLVSVRSLFLPMDKPSRPGSTMVTFFYGMLERSCQAHGQHILRDNEY